MKSKIATYLIAASISALCTAASFGAKAGNLSEASAVSMLITASVVVTASEGVSTLLKTPVALSTAGATLVIKGVQASGRGTVYVLERVSDGARTSIEVVGNGITSSAAAVGGLVVVSIIGSGTVLSAAGEAIAFIPNAQGQALLHNERLTN